MSGTINTNLPREASNGVIQTASTLLFKDATGTPKTSPLTVPALSSSVTTILVPDNAVEIELTSSVALRVGTDVAALTSQYYVVPASTAKRFMLGKETTLYIAGDSAEAVVSFHFNLV